MKSPAHARGFVQAWTRPNIATAERSAIPTHRNGCSRTMRTIFLKDLTLVSFRKN